MIRCTGRRCQCWLEELSSAETPSHCSPPGPSTGRTRVLEKKLRIENKQSHILFIWYPLAVTEWLKLIVNIKIRYTVNNLVCSRQSPNEFSALIVNKWGNLTWVSSWNYWRIFWFSEKRPSVSMRMNPMALVLLSLHGYENYIFTWQTIDIQRQIMTHHIVVHVLTNISFDSLSQILIIFCDKLQIANIHNFFV